MNGPVNKVAFGLAARLIAQGNIAIMGCIAAAESLRIAAR